jgi:hypothetical protein
MKDTLPDSDVGGEEAIVEDLLKNTSISRAAAGKAPDQACKLNISHSSPPSNCIQCHVLHLLIP